MWAQFLFLFLTHLYVTCSLETDRELIFQFLVHFVFYPLPYLEELQRARRRPSPQLRPAGVVPRLNPTPLDSSFYLVAAVVLPLTSTPIPSTAASVGCVQDVTDGYRMSPTGGVGCSAQQVRVSED